MNLTDAREANDGTLPAYAWPGGYPMLSTGRAPI